jgi:hypothetical protein
MQTHEPGKTRKLEWWQYRSGGIYSPLWDTTTGPAPSVPTGSETVYGNPVAAGMLSWRHKNQQRFDTLLTVAALDRYMLDVERDVYGCLYVRDRNRYMHAAAADCWPDRCNKWDSSLNDITPVVPRRLREDVLQVLLAHEETDRQPKTEAELVSRFGIDASMLVALGGWKKLLSALPPADSQHFTNIVEPIPIPPVMQFEDPAIRSWYSTAFSCQPALPTLSVGSTFAQMSVKLVLAGNGSGKSTFINHSGAASGVVDSDSVLRDAGYLKAQKLGGTKHLPRISNAVATRAAALLASKGPSVLLTQYPPSVLLPVLRAANIRVSGLAYVDNDLYDIFTRVSTARMWDINKVERRFSRFNESCQKWCNELGMMAYQSSDIGGAISIC